MPSSLARLLLPLALPIALVAAAASRGSIFAEPAGPARGPKFVEVAPGVFFAEAETEPAFLGSNSGFVVLADEVVVVDASFPITATALLDEIRRRSDRPVRFAFDTHWHPDHAFGNSVFAAAGAAIVAQRRCADDERARGARMFDEQARSPDAGRRKPVEGASFRAATVVFDDRLVLDDGTRQVELLHFGRGHTRGDAVAWLPRERVLFTGDLCVNGAWNYLGDGDSEHWIEVLDRLIALQPKVVCPGHGAVGGPEMLVQQRRWLVELRAAVAAALAAGAADADAVASKLDLPWYREWSGVDASSRKENVARVFAELAGLVTPPLLVDDLGLRPGLSPSRESSGDGGPAWSAPKKVAVAGMDDAQLAALRRVAPGVELVPLPREPGAAGAAIADADALIGACSAALLDAGRKLRWVQVGSAGVERHVGLPRIASREVCLTNAQRLYGPEIADHAVGMLLALTRALPAALDNQRGARGWELPAAAGDAMVELRGKRALVAGLGGIGREIAQRLAAFGARVVATEARPKPPPSYVERVGGPDALLELAKDADFVFVCTPLTKETEKLFDARFFAAAKPGARLVNVARGRCVDTEALVAALKSGRLAGAALDVTDPEPLPPDHELWKLGNVIVTPHDAATSDAAEARQFLLCRENLRRFVAGEPLLSVVDPSAGY
jgi:phosphoglycerate dehydrogenase-like enzyme/glyoxylase-like metal-dependent hydrolase (beta-lactamase superfamily II)